MLVTRNILKYIKLYVEPYIFVIWWSQAELND